MGYIPALDGVRAVAILIVVLVHSRLPGVEGGWAGVDVFFVLSGFLITRLLADEHARSGRIALIAFYARRLRRLYPALLLLIAAYLLAGPWLFPSVDSRAQLLDAGTSALYLSDYVRTFGFTPPVLGHLWSLSVEEHFYLVWPLVLLTLLRLPRNQAQAWIAGLYVGMTLWRLAAYEIGLDHLYFRFDTHSSGLFLGCWLGLANVRLRAAWGWIGLAGVIACVIGAYESRYAITLVEVFAALLVAGRPPELGALAWLGRMSYGWYLWHSPMMLWTRFNVSMEPWAQLVIGGLGGLLIAAISYYTIEAVFRRPRRAVEPGQTATIPSIDGRKAEVSAL